MRIGWFIPTESRDYDHISASIWLRCLQLVPYLTALGVDSVINERDCDIGVFVRWQNEEARHIALSLREGGKPVVFDMVANYFEPSHATYMKHAVAQQHVSECTEMVKLADAITCSSAFITEQAREHHQNVHYIPDSVDLAHFRNQKPSSDFNRKRLRALWCGVAAKAGDIRPILPLLKRHGFDLTIVSNERPKLRGRKWFSLPFPYDYYRWAYSRPDRLLNGEIALGYRDLSHVYDNGHSFFKVGLPLSQGLPVVASPVPSYKEIIRDDRGGALCGSLEEFDQCLGELARSRDKLKQWSRQGIEIMKEYSTGNIAKDYARFFNTLS